MRQRNYISKIRVGILLFFIFPLKSFCQDISGVWVGYMYNDTTQQTIHYELAINDVNGKTSGFSHTTFIIDDVKNIGVKEVKVRLKKDQVYVEDEKFVYDNYAQPAAKGVKMFSFLTLSKNDSAEVLSGIWRTNATRKYNPLTGSIFLLKKKKVEPQQTIIVKKLIELGLASQLTFLPPSLNSRNDVAVNDKVAPASSSVSTKLKPLTNGKTELPQANKVPGNEQAVVINEANPASKNNLSSGVTRIPNKEKNEAETKSAVPGKTNEQPTVKAPDKNATTVQIASKESDDKTVAMNETVQNPQNKKTSSARISSNANGEEPNTSTTFSDVNSTAKPLDTKETNEKTLAINETTQNSQNNKTSPAPITSNASKSITATKVKTPAKPIDKNETKENTVAINETTQNPHNKKSSPSAITSKTVGEVENKSNNASLVKTSGKPTDTKESNNNTVAINEKKIPEQQQAVSDNANSLTNQKPVSQKPVPPDKKTTNVEVANQANTSDLKSSLENKNESAEKQVATNQKIKSTVDKLQKVNNKNSSSTAAEIEKNKENVSVVTQQKVNTIAAQPNEISSSIDKQPIGENNNKAKDLEKTGAVNQQKTVKINALSNQQKPNSLEPAVVINPKFITPPAAADLSKRKLETIRTVEIAEDSLVFSLYDNGSIDGDTVSVLMNGKVIMPRVGLLASAISKTVYLTPEMGDSVSVVMYAENLGSIPPNTGLLVIHDGPKIYEIRFSGDLNKNSKIILVRKKKT